eukprot:TRINITY_DN180_c1_g3_i1.p1 TRINITY_DN180_c1_g3~~TRINITY_DN180_c1_g3_i1.p1  ORF type:complete len:1523 (+),score=213.81 TRINITY_DN180_c1_g3_i1:863-5431(+)
MTTSLLVVHYHRACGDYYRWSLIVRDAHGTRRYGESVPAARTAFGALFRVPLPEGNILRLQLVHPSLVDCEKKPFDLASVSDVNGEKHVFVMEASEMVAPKPRQLTSWMSVHTECHDGWLVVYGFCTKRDVFGATAHYRVPQVPPLFVLDATQLSSTVSFAVQRSHHHALASDAQSSFATFHAPFPQHVSLFPHSRHASCDLFQLLVQQASRSKYLSSQIHSAQSLAVIPPSIPVPSKHLILFYYRLDRSTPVVTIAIKATTNTATTSLQPISLPSPYHTARAFSVDITPLLQQRNTNQSHDLQLSIVPVRTSSATTIQEAPLNWRPSLGLRVIYAQSFPTLLTPSNVDLSIVYHRYDHHWAEWELHVWTHATEHYPAFTTKLTPTRPYIPGQIVFHLIGFIFPYKAQVYAEPVRMRLYPARTTVNDFGHTIVGEPYRDACRRDVVREWTSGEPPAQILHFVQGDSKIYVRPPEPQRFNSQRYFKIRYRRFLPSDYDGWDLWSWDATDPASHRVALEPVAETRAWTDFVVDRACYGGAGSICLLPRRGGGSWLEKDGAERVWNACLLEVYSERNIERSQSDDQCGHLPTFIITQHTSFVLRSLNEVKSMMDAYVDGDDSVIVTMPVPFEWVAPPKKSGGKSAPDITFKLCERSVQRPFDGEEQNHNLVPGRMLRYRKSKQLSPTKVRFLFDPSVATFEEDFLVENVIVDVAPFAAVCLHWEKHQDEDKYFYDGMLGWMYSAEQCVFRCFAPAADQVSVVLYDAATGDAGRLVVPMRRIPEGCWKATIARDLKGMYYKLLAEGEDKRLFPGVEVIDPYSKCNTAHNGRGLIYGTDTSTVYERPSISAAELIVYELHIRDITIDKFSGIRSGGKFLGLAERGTKMKMKTAETPQSKALTPWEQEAMPGAEKESLRLHKFSTGLDHIAQMGVTAIQIMPVQDFDNDEADDTSYRWGYMPVHFNSPDGWYASSTYSAARVKEFKKLVSAAHKAGLRVIMDVVYNHTAEDSNEFNLEARFSFNGLAPRYYYRTCGNTPVAHNGESTCGRRKANEPRCGECYSNGSGCGNEFRSESPMGRKFIIDSLKFWVTEYGVDGFRFDLLGLIDVDTIQRAVKELKAIDSGIVVYGEPWIGGLSPIKATDKGSQRSKGFAVFNDSFRNAIRGSPFDTEETFIVDGGRVTEVKGGIIGSVDMFADSPFESINYVECHDNRTLWDHLQHYIRLRTDTIKFTEEDVRRMHKLAAVLVLTSQGIPFIQAGQEMCRTKFDDENSYESPDEINMIRWGTKLKEWSTVQYYRGLILLRRAHPEIFCLETADEIHDKIVFYEDCGLNVPDRCIAYRIKGDPEKLLKRLQKKQPEIDLKETTPEEESQRWSEVAVLFNATPLQVVFELPGKETDVMWMQVVNSSAAGTRTINGPLIGSLEVGGRSAAVVRRASPQECCDLQLEMRLGHIAEAHCSFHGDDPISRYAVGLEPWPTREEQALKNESISKRLHFQKKAEAIDKMGEDVMQITSAKTVQTRNAPEKY